MFVSLIELLFCDNGYGYKSFLSLFFDSDDDDMLLFIFVNFAVAYYKNF